MCIVCLGGEVGLLGNHCRSDHRDSPGKQPGNVNRHLKNAFLMLCKAPDGKMLLCRFAMSQSFKYHVLLMLFFHLRGKILEPV